MIYENWITIWRDGKKHFGKYFMDSYGRWFKIKYLNINKGGYATTVDVSCERLGGEIGATAEVLFTYGFYKEVKLYEESEIKAIIMVLK